MPEIEILPGAIALQKYIDDNYESVNAFAKEHLFNQSELSKLLRGERQRVSVETANRVERATRGKVTWRMWIP